MVDSRTDTPLKMTEAKRKAHVWAVFFHTLETIDVITVSVCTLYSRHAAPAPPLTRAQKYSIYEFKIINTPPPRPFFFSPRLV